MGLGLVYTFPSACLYLSFALSIPFVGAVYTFRPGGGGGFGSVKVMLFAGKDGTMRRGDTQGSVK